MKNAGGIASTTRRSNEKTELENEIGGVSVWSQPFQWKRHIPSKYLDQFIIAKIAGCIDIGQDCPFRSHILTGASNKNSNHNF